MNGMELAKAFYETYGRPMLEEQFPEILPYLACGLAGSGSECLGYDDEISRDHDFEPGFCIFLPGEELVDRRTAFRLERAYAKLPASFMGVERPRLLPVGGARRGVLRTADFFREKTGTPDGNLDLLQWLAAPEQALLESTGGELFFDNLGEITKIRENLRYFPEDVRLKKLAGQLLLMGQSGQYNYSRCLGHGETAAAQLAAGEFVKSTVNVIFLLNRIWQPYYKWVFRALRGLPRLSELAPQLEYLLTTGNDPETAGEKSAVIEKITKKVTHLLAEQELIVTAGYELEAHAYEVNDRIRDGMLRNMHVLAAV